MEEKFKLFLSTKYPEVQLVSKYINAKTKIVLKYKCGCTKEVIPSNLQSRGNGSKCLIHVQGRETEPISHTPSGGLKDFSLFFANNYKECIMLSEYLGAHTKVKIQYIGCKCIKELVPTNMRTRKDGTVCEIHEGTIRKEATKVFLGLMHIRFPLIEIISEYINSITRVNIRCVTCHNTWDGIPAVMASSGSRCVCHVCTPIKYRKSEQEVADFISSIYTGWMERSDRSILSGKELDIVLPDLGLAFEYNGIYWHSDEFRDKDYHLNKTEQVKDFQYQLIHIMEDEWVNKKEIVKSRISSLLGKSTKLQARKCVVKEVAAQQAKDFLDRCHLRGSGAPSKYNIGLFFEDKLVAIQTFREPKTVSSQEYELVRYCSELNTNVIGGASKLLSYFVKTYNPKGIVSYSDKRWSNGNLYKKLGFEFTHTSPPGYTYYKGLQSFSRYKFQKHKLQALFPEIYKEELTESAIMKEAGYTKVYDCGNDVWVLK